MNNTVLVGRITRNLELKHTRSGIPNVFFTLAVPRDFKNQETGERETDFISCVAWRGLAETMVKFLKKGSRIGLEGRLQTRSYEKEGRTVYVTEVVTESFEFLDYKKDLPPANLPLVAGDYFGDAPF